MASKAELESNVTGIDLLIERRLSGIKRLDNLVLEEGPDITDKVLVQYNILKIEELGQQDRYTLAIQLMSADLLLATLYAHNGTPTIYGKPWIKPNKEIDREIDLEDYVYFGNRDISFPYFSKFNKHSEAKTLGVLMSNYAVQFQEKNEDPQFILIPGEIVINQDEGKVEVRSEDNFVPPWSLNGSGYVTVYRNMWHKPRLK